MRLISAHLRHYRLHRDLTVAFDPRFTVIAGPNQSGKSTLAEALHRALFLSARSGGDLLKGMQSSPFRSDPEVELTFEAEGERWTLFKRYAGNRGSASLEDSRGGSLRGEAAEERLAQLIGTGPVPRNRAAAEQLRDRWGHLWVWQGMASSNPLERSAAAYDHDRLVERLQAGADLSVQSPLDLAVIEDIQARWSAIHTAGGASRAPQVRRGSALQQARTAVLEAREALAAIEGQIAQQTEAEQALVAAGAELARIAQALPLLQAQRQELEARLARSRALEAAIAAEEPVLAALNAELEALVRDRQELQRQGQRLQELQAAMAPERAALETLEQQRPAREEARRQAQRQLEEQRQRSARTAAAASALEGRQTRLRLLQALERLSGQQAEQERLQSRQAALDRDLQALPPVDATAVERLRRLAAEVERAQVRADALATGVTVVRSGEPVRLDGQPLAEGSTRLLTEAAVLQVGDAVELRLVPGGGAGVGEARRTLALARQTLGSALERWGLATVEEAATAERRRSDLLAERERLLEQRRGVSLEELAERRRLLSQRLATLAVDPADGTPGGPALEAALMAVETALPEARQAREAAAALERQHQELQARADAGLEAHRQQLERAAAQLRERENQLLEARTRVDALQQRHGSLESLQNAIRERGERRNASQARLEAHRAAWSALAPAGLREQGAGLEQRIAALQHQQREAEHARIRAEGRLHADGRLDPQAEREQTLAALESGLQEQERLEKEAAMLTLLRDLLEEEQTAMATQYTAPLTQRVGRHLAAVFGAAPEASLSYDARGGFHGLQWRRGQEAAFGFEVLSTGAREQFAAALRIAMAEVLAEAYGGCLPVLFDDAFANSDPERQRGLHRMLEGAADQGLQIILLTCDPERSQTIGGARRIRLGD